MMHMTIKWILLKICNLPPLPFPKHNTKFSKISNSEINFLKFHWINASTVIVASTLVAEWKVNLEDSGSIPASCKLFWLTIIWFWYALINLKSCWLIQMNSYFSLNIKIIGFVFLTRPRFEPETATLEYCREVASFSIEYITKSYVSKLDLRYVLTLTFKHTWSTRITVTPGQMMQINLLYLCDNICLWYCHLLTFFGSERGLFAYKRQWYCIWWVCT